MLSSTELCTLPTRNETAEWKCRKFCVFKIDKCFQRKHLSASWVRLSARLRFAGCVILECFRVQAYEINPKGTCFHEFRAEMVRLIERLLQGSLRCCDWWDDPEPYKLHTRDVSCGNSGFDTWNNNAGPGRAVRCQGILTDGHWRWRSTNIWEQITKYV